jgi:hypothetical protein
VAEVGSDEATADGMGMEGPREDGIRDGGDGQNGDDQAVEEIVQSCTLLPTDKEDMANIQNEIHGSSGAGEGSDEGAAAVSRDGGEERSMEEDENDLCARGQLKTLVALNALKPPRQIAAVVHYP